MKQFPVFFAMLFCGLLIPGLSAQQTPDKSGVATYRFKVDNSDALIHALTVGRGSGARMSNTALGYSALFRNNFGENNTAVGFTALYNNLGGESNTGIGDQVLFSNTEGYQNTATGASALYKNETGFGNTATGYMSLLNNTTGRNNTASGLRSMQLNATGYSNVAVGVSALNQNTTRSNLVAVGDSALFQNGKNVSQSWHATANTAIGSKALYANTRGSHNTAVGFQSLHGNMTGHHNSALGYHALFYNASGTNNTAVGNFALSVNSVGYDNVGVGYHALSNNLIGYKNVTIGAYAMGLSSDGVNPIANVAIGYEAGGLITTGYGNVLIGEETGRCLTTGFNNVWLGKKIGLTGSSERSNTVVIGANTALPNFNNMVYIGNTSMGWIGGQVTWSTYADLAAKSEVHQDVPGLDFIMRLRPVTFQWDVDAMNARLGVENPEKHEGYYDIESERITGFLAQEVEEAAMAVGYDFSGVDKTGDVYSLRYAEFVVPLVKAVQEQQAQIELLEPAVVEALQMELQEVRAENAGMQQVLKMLKTENELMREQLDQILTLLKAQGLDLGSGSTGNPSRGSGRSQRDASGNTAQLEQNAPNPFQENTSIRYFLPENNGKALIVITDLQGNRIQTLDISGSGFGEVTIHGGSMAPGTYVYSLVVSGRVADSKRMVLL